MVAEEGEVTLSDVVPYVVTLTLHPFVADDVADRISQVAFDRQAFRQFDLHAVVYHNVKAETGLNANHVVRAIAKVAHAYKLDTKTLRTCSPLGSIELDKDLLTWKVESPTTGRQRQHGSRSSQNPVRLLCRAYATSARKARSGRSAAA